jgi:Mg2+ and Co2+ transporter CorA
LLKRGDDIVWVDVPMPDDESIATLGEVFGFHPRRCATSRCAIPVPRLLIWGQAARKVVSSMRG